MKPLAIICPSRERPRVCDLMTESALKTSQADIYLYVDNDDPTNSQYRVIDPARVKLVFGDPIGRGEAVNHLCNTYRDYEMYLVTSDDGVFVREGWDTEVVEAMRGFGDGIGVVHLESETHATYVNWACVSRKWIDTLGWYNYPGCRQFCQDTILQVLAEALGRIVQTHPTSIHHNVINHPDVWARLQADQHAFLWYMAKYFGRDLAKLRAVMK